MGYQETPTFEQMRALYTLVMTVLFQTAGTMVSKTVQESAAVPTTTTVPSNTKELSRRLKAAQSLKEKTKLIRRITSPLNFWETQNLIKNQSQTTKQIKMPIAPYFQHHRSQDKCQTRPSSTTSSKTSQKAQNSQTKWIRSSSTPLEPQSLSTGGQ